MCSVGNDETWTSYETGVTQFEYDALNALIKKQVNFNGWFTEMNVRRSFIALGETLSEESLNKWLRPYSFAHQSKKVAVIMAGNIPLVGFHDFIAVLLSGNRIVCKLSSDDQTLLPALAKILIQFVPDLEAFIEFSTGKIGMIDAVIATGSNNSLLYFEKYFGKYPHLFRKNRTSVAVIEGDETADDFHQLGHDLFDYFGLGCRNVTHLLLPVGFDLNRFFESIVQHFEVINNHKYANNYDYNKAIYLLNQEALLDNNFVLLKESDQLFSPLSVIHYHYYNDFSEVDQFLEKHRPEIQVVVGKSFIPFGQTQRPSLDDYADGIDTMKFLNELNF